MSGYKMHWFVGLMFTIGILLVDNYFKLGLIGTDLVKIGILVAITLFYSILPDIDTTSKVRSIVLPFALILSFILLLLGNKIIGMAIIAILIAVLMLRHRGLTHRHWFTFIIALPVLFFYGLNLDMIKVQLLYYIVAVVSYESHLLIDGVRG